MIHPSRWIVDAGVAIKWFVPEPDSALAHVLLSRPGQLLAPDIIVPEFGNVLWKKVRRGEISRGDADRFVQSFLTRRPLDIRPSHSLLRHALDIATTYGRTVYDSLYVALAVAQNCPMVTADQRLVNTLQGTPLASSLAALSSI
jgi:predicted nucleic acid-binding protein